MRRSAKLLGLAAAIVVGSTARPALADADSLVDHLGATEVGVGEAMRAGAIGAMATRLNPAGLPLTNELVFDGSFGYRPSDSAQLGAVAACDSTNLMPGCFYYSYVAADPGPDGSTVHERAHTGGITLSRMINQRITVGWGMKYFDFESDGMDEGSGVNWDIGTTVRITETANLALVGYNLWGAESPQFPRAVAAGTMIRPVPQLALSFDAVWELGLEDDQQTGRYGGGAAYILSGNNGQVGYPIRAGAVHDVGTDGTYVTGGLGFATMKMGIDIAARKQVSEGDELLVTAGIRLYGPRQPM